MLRINEGSSRTILKAGACLFALSLIAACQSSDGVNVTTSSVPKTVDDGNDSADGGGDGNGNGNGNGGGDTASNTGTVGKVGDVAGKTGGKVLHVAGSTTILLAAVLDGTGDRLPSPVGGVVDKTGTVVGAVGTKVVTTGAALRADGLNAIPPVGKTVTVVDGLTASLLKASVTNHTLLGYSNPASNQLVNASVLSNTAQTGKSAVSAGVLSTGSVAKVSVAGKTLVNIPAGGGSGGGGGTAGGVVGGTTGAVGGLLNKVVSINK